MPDALNRVRFRFMKAARTRFEMQLYPIPVSPRLAYDRWNLRRIVHAAYPAQRFFLIRVRIASAVVLAVALWAGTRWLGMIGAIVAVVCVITAERLFTAFHFARILHITIKDIGILKDHLKLAIAAALGWVVAALVRVPLIGVGRVHPLVVLVVCGIAFLAVYGVAILLLKVPTEEEKDMVLTKLRLRA